LVFILDNSKDCAYHEPFYASHLINLIYPDLLFWTNRCRHHLKPWGMITNLTVIGAYL